MPKRRVNTRKKGRRKELLVRDVLVKAGYSVIMSPTPTRWARQTDLLGLWDLIGIGTDDVVCIQVKSVNSVPREWKLKAKAWKCPVNCRKELWVMEDRKKPRVITL